MKTTLFLTFLLSFFICLPASLAATKISCSHPELCRLARIIFAENNISKYEFESLVQIKGDPHEFEPSTKEVKSLIKAAVLLTGPVELNPWIKKITYQRSKVPHLVTVNIPLDKKDYDLYPGSSHETLSHFWLYPKIFCSLKTQMESKFIALQYLVVSAKDKFCFAEEKIITNTLQKTVADLKLPVVLTHDALLPLFESLMAKGTQGTVVAIKGSGHHDEASSASVKKLYDALKAPKVIWIIEDKIHVPQNILAKKRSSDLVVKIDTANSDSLEYFQVLGNLNARLQALKK